jgi:hypothetical protein
MTSSLKATDRPSVLIPAIEEVPRISDAERSALHTSLEKASADIAAGQFDALTPELLRGEFDAIYHGDESKTEIDAEPEQGVERGAPKS